MNNMPITTEDISEDFLTFIYKTASKAATVVSMTKDSLRPLVSVRRLAGKPTTATVVVSAICYIDVLFIVRDYR